MQRSDPVVLEMTRDHAVALIATVQLACRHPGFTGPTRQIVARMARKLQAAMAEDSPEAGRLIEQGWHPVYDVQRGG